MRRRGLVIGLVQIFIDDKTEYILLGSEVLLCDSKTNVVIDYFECIDNAKKKLKEFNKERNHTSFMNDDY